ncbi:MAG: MerR family transcriptional regulator [Bacteroidaceae bacterium]|nr:MerR family transcriptional regulator [Bacteroidales bacterium]MBQ2877634.1 MerR family transcriptional regulator [Bacteroidaceae bacterium]MBQ3622882.1 MerR family transcriptional regulator [Bacteroidaceae bacterium]MBR7135246.1 MerR family transcriptional regulator [Bacteroidaceae bacterium]
MTLHKNKELKLYYSIKEVASELGVNESTLRYWETEFPQIAPKKGANNVRRYTKEDIKTVRLVHHLVKDKGLTLAGAKQYLKQNGNKEIARTNSDVIERLRAVREELLGIKAALEHL